MGDEFYGQATVDLRSGTPPQDEHRTTARPQRQRAHCFTNRSSILDNELKGSRVPALEALRRAHP